MLCLKHVLSIGPRWVSSLQSSTRMTVRSFSHQVDIRNELFIKKCADLISRRGYGNIHLGVEKTNRRGEVEEFDIVYGYIIKHYCRCHFGEEVVTEEEIKAFEVGLLDWMVDP